MTKSLFPLTILVVIIFLHPLTCYGKIGYVSDMLLLSLREGPGNSFALIKTLTSNTPVEILEEKNKYYKVALESNEVGWVDKKFIIFTEPKILIINQLKIDNAALEKKLIKTRSDSTLLQNSLASLQQEHARLKKEYDILLKREKSRKMDPDGELPENIKKIIRENEIIKKKHQVVSDELAVLKNKKDDLFKTGMIKWFLSGTAVLLLGWIIGQSVSIKKQRPSSLLR